MVKKITNTENYLKYQGIAEKAKEVFEVIDEFKHDEAHKYFYAHSLDCELYGFISYLEKILKEFDKKQK